jgi:hypothetical protein
MITYNNAKDNQLDILSEDFTSSDWSNYVTYDNTTSSGQLSKFPTQSRKNLRSFVPVKGRGLTMLELNALGEILSWSSKYDMTALLTSAKTTEGEVWTNGTVAYDETVTQNCLKITIPPNTTSINTESTFDTAIDLTNFDLSNYKIDFAFPNYQAGSISSITASFYSSTVTNPTAITLTVSNNKASIDLSSSLIPYDALKSLNKIKLTITPSGTAGIFYCSQIICVSKNYVYPVVDWNTQTNRLTKTNQTATFPTPSVDSSPATTIGKLWNIFPPMIKSYAGITGTTIGDCSKDPQPVNINVSMIFNTGLLPTSGDNQIGLILRETGNLGISQVNSPTGLQGKRQDAMPGPLTLSPKLTPTNVKGTTHLYFASISWNSTGATIKFEDESQTSRVVYYNIQITNGLVANTNYEFNVLLEDNKFRFIIKKLTNQYSGLDYLGLNSFTMTGLNNLGSIGYWSNDPPIGSISPSAGWADNYYIDNSASIFDTGWIYDSKIQRRKGRFGWWANLLDNQSYVRKIAVNSASYAEYVSNPLKSKTPVNGVQVFSESSPAIRKFTKGYAFGSGAILSNTKTDEYVISTVTSGDMVQGFCTNDFTVNNSKLKIDFNLFVNNKNDISAYLLSTEKDIEVRIDLSLGNIKSNRINKIDLILNNLKFGNYKLYVVQEVLRKNQITINNLTINSPQVQWSARPNVIDNWIDYDLDNTSMNEGLMFSERGKNLQIKGAAKTQFASIKKVKSVPKYADLGAFQWSDSINSFRNITDTRLNKQSSGFYISTSANPTSDGSLTKVRLQTGSSPSISDTSITDPFDTYGLSTGTLYYFQGYLGSMTDTWSNNVKYQWLFDDGTVQTGKSISYKFNYAPDASFTANEDEYCLHTVILKIYVNDKLINTVTKHFYVQTP